MIFFSKYIWFLSCISHDYNNYLLFMVKLYLLIRRTLAPGARCARGVFTYYVIIFLNSQAEFCSRRTPQLVLAESYNINQVTWILFVTRGFHVCLCPKVVEVTDDYIICKHTSTGTAARVTLQQWKLCFKLLSISADNTSIICLLIMNCSINFPTVRGVC